MKHLSGMHKQLIGLILIAFLGIGTEQLMAQPGQRPEGNGEFQRNVPKGRFYGKVVDSDGKGIGYATVQLTKEEVEPSSDDKTNVLVNGQITDDNGDFDLKDIPVFGEYTLTISFIGYTEVTQKVSFDPPASPGGPPSGFAPGGGFDKDLGNIALNTESAVLDEVIVTADKANFTLAIDKREYRVEKDASVTGGNAVDALRNIPSLSVDLDGNVTLRNGSPQIFIDGRPSTISLDQISADMISTVEVITNPSARYDAGGGAAGIVNIVLKKEKRLGYNGMLMGGTDSNGGLQAMANVNARSENTNVFLSSMLFRRIGEMNGETFQQNLTTDPLTNITQISLGQMKGMFGNVRGGVDWFVDNRNTLTFQGGYTRGKFQPEETFTSTIDSLFANGTSTSQSVRFSDQDRNFRNMEGAILFKHLFPKEGAEWTADITFNKIRFRGFSDYMTMFDSGTEALENQANLGDAQFITIQTDIINPLSESIKLESGLRASIRENTSRNKNSFFNTASEEWEDIYRLTDAFGYTDNIYAAYGILNHELDGWAYQVGLRAESSFYTGKILDENSTFEINYPLSLFPSGFLTKTFSESSNMQFSYTRRINRPNFFQTLPFTDVSNSVNPRRGNTLLKPEFTNSLELSYQKIFSGNHNLLVSTYFKQASDLITTLLVEEFVPALGREAIVSTYINSNSSSAYGTEFTLKNKFFDKVDLTSNVNLYQSRVDASNTESDLIVDRFTWFIKENVSVELPAGFTLQLTGEYRSRASFTPSDGQQRGFRSFSMNSAQGYQLSNWYVNTALRKQLLNRKLTLTLNVNDIFRTNRMGSFTESDIFVQESYRYFEPQVVRLNVNYNFGKRDASIFKRKNTNQNSQGGDMMN